MTADPSAIDRWVKRVVLLALAVFLCALSFFLLRMGMMAYRVEQSIEATAGDVAQVTKSAADISRRVDEINDRIGTLQEKAEQALRLDEVEGILDNIIHISSGDESEGGPPPEAADQIAYLLRCIWRSGHRFEYADSNRSASRFYLELYGKYKLLKRTIPTAEVFIEKLGTKTIPGNRYYVVFKDGKKKELDVWLTEALKAYRDEKAKSDGAKER